VTDPSEWSFLSNSCYFPVIPLVVSDSDGDFWLLVLHTILLISKLTFTYFYSFTELFGSDSIGAWVNTSTLSLAYVTLIKVGMFTESC
jgi:hypothetical protein